LDFNGIFRLFFDNYFEISSDKNFDDPQFIKSKLTKSQFFVTIYCF